MLGHHANWLRVRWGFRVCAVWLVFDGRRCWVLVYIFTFGVWGDECFAAIYNLPDLGLEGICGVFVVVLNLLASMKSVILESYCFMGRIIKEFPLSARVTMASFYLSFVFMLLTIFAPGCVLCVRWGYFLYQGTDTFGCQFPVRLLGLWGGVAWWRSLLLELGFGSSMWVWNVNCV